VSANLGVPTLHRSVVDYANFDHAASTPALESVKTAVDIALRTYSSVHRGNGYASRILVVFTRNSTDSLNLLARSLPKDTTTFVFESEHHAALLAWNPARTVRIPVPGSEQDALILLEDALRSSARTTTGPRLVVVTGASNVTGELWPIESIVSIAKRYGARVALDAAQLAPHRKIDIETQGVDYVVFSGHKLYAPFGAGVLAGRADWLNDAAPYLRGGGATEKVTSDETVWTQGAARHEAGSPNVIGAIAIAAACAAGETVVTGAEELRVKESDRIAAMSAGLEVLGVVHQVLPDGMRIEGRGEGPAFGGGEIDSRGDHRIAMSFAVASLRAAAAISIRDVANVATSFPGFVGLACRVGLDIHESAG